MKRTRRGWLWLGGVVLAAGLAIVACSDDSTTVPAGAIGAGGQVGGGSPGGGAGHDGGAGGLGGSGATGPSSVPYTHRGLFALPRGGGEVYLGWRYLVVDDESTVFHVHRRAAGEPSYGEPISGSGVGDSSNFVDTTAELGQTYSYVVRAETDGLVTESNEVTVEVIDDNPRHFVVPTLAEGEIERVVTGDFDGDGLMDFVYVWPEYHLPGEGDPVPVHTMGVSLHDGTGLWTLHLGEGTAGWIFPTPFTAFDLDADGRDEVLVRTSVATDPNDYGQDSLTVLDGLTGAVKQQVSWVPKVNGDPNENSRNYIGIAFLDGQTPHVIIGRGTYAKTRLAAYDPNLEQVWELTLSAVEGRAAHGMEVADIDEDGNDEIFWGDVIVDETGQVVWTAPNVPYNGHPDLLFVADILPDRPGLEYYIGNEGWGAEKDPKIGGTVYASDGSIVGPHWPDMNKGHLHVGFMGDITAQWDGMEIWASGSVTNGSGQVVHGFHDATGELTIETEYFHSNFGVVQWDEDPPQRIYQSGHFWHYDDDVDDVVLWGMSGFYRGGVIADILGDYREEVINCRDSEGCTTLYVLTNTVEVGKRQLTAVLDRKYRTDMARTGMEYQRQSFRGGTAFTPLVYPLTVAGTVTEQGVGVADVTVRLEGEVAEAGLFSRSTTTGPAGHYELVGIPAYGSFVLTAERIGCSFAPASSPITLIGADMDGQDFVATCELSIESAIDQNNCADPYVLAKVGVGDAHYVDRDYTITSIPPGYEDSYWLRTAMDDKTCSHDPLATLTALEDVDIAIGYQTSAASLPGWLQNWTDTGQTIAADHSPNGAAEFRLYRKSFGPGPIELGPCSADSDIMYVVLVP